MRGSLFILSTHKVCLQTQLHLILEIKSFYNLLSKFPTFKCQRKTFPLQNRHLINIFQKKKRTKNRKKLSCTPYRDFFHDYEDYLWFIFQYLPKLSSWKELKALSKSSQGKGCWNDRRIIIVRKTSFKTFFYIKHVISKELRYKLIKPKNLDVSVHVIRHWNIKFARAFMVNCCHKDKRMKNL